MTARNFKQDELLLKILNRELAEQNILIDVANRLIFNIINHLNYIEESEDDDLLKIVLKEELAKQYAIKANADMQIFRIEDHIQLIGNIPNIDMQKLSKKSKNIEQEKSKNYKPELGWWEKVKFILKLRNKISSINQILETAVELGENLRVGTDEYKKARSNLSAVLKTYNDRKDLYRKKLNADAPFYYYGLPEWFNDGEFGEEYVP